MILLSIFVILLLLNVLGLSNAQAIGNGLNITAISEDVLASHTNTLPNYIIASITDLYGQPITGLGQTNFKVNAIIVPPGGEALVNITRVVEDESPGIYILHVVPGGTDNWENGSYIFAIKVFSEQLHGQTLVRGFIK
jgi:hypothetical protein